MQHVGTILRTVSWRALQLVISFVMGSDIQWDIEGVYPPPTWVLILPARLRLGEISKANFGWGFLDQLETYRNNTGVIAFMATSRDRWLCMDQQKPLH